MRRAARLVTATLALILVLSAAREASAQLRGLRYCEVLGIYLRAGGLEADVWNTAGFNLCPQADWEALDAESIRQELGAVAVFLNGPRFWMMDFITTPNTQTPVMDFGNLTMRLAATVALPSGGPASPYSEVSVARDTRFIFYAGSEVYELVDPTGRLYIMQSYSNIVDETLSEADLPGLGARLQLPPGWRYRVRVLPEEYVVEDQAGVATVVQDELTNTYQWVGPTPMPTPIPTVLPTATPTPTPSKKAKKVKVKKVKKAKKVKLKKAKKSKKQKK